MPSTFVPINVVIELFDRSEIGIDVLLARLISKLAKGEIYSRSESAKQCSLKRTEYDNIEAAIADLNLTGPMRHFFLTAAARDKATHASTAQWGYVSILPTGRGVTLFLSDEYRKVDNAEIAPPYWLSFDCLHRSLETVVCWDVGSNTRSTFFRVELCRKDLIEAGLLSPKAILSKTLGRRKLYDSAICNTQFIIWRKNNMQMDQKGQCLKLQDIYRENGFAVGKDEGFKAEKRTIAALGRKVDKTPN